MSIRLYHCVLIVKLYLRLEGIQEEAIRRYLIRKPMSISDLLKKFKTMSMSNEERGKVIVSILRKINPLKQEIHGKLHFHVLAEDAKT